MSKHILEICHLSKTFGTHAVLKDIDFTVDQGDVTSIIGASGSGKRTLLRCINLLETRTTGEILFHGEDVTKGKINPSAYRAKVGMVFQNFNLFNNMTVLANCMIGQQKVSRVPKEEAKKPVPPPPPKEEVKRPEPLPRDWNGRIAQAMAYIRAQDYAAADVLLESMLKERPKDLNALLLRAAAQAGTKSFYAAQGTLERAMRAHPRSYLPYYNLANLLIQQGEDFETAREYYELGRTVGGPVNKALEARLKGVGK